MKKTSYAKGKELEEQFAEFMKTELGWTDVRVGVHLVGKINRKGSSVDIVGKRLSEQGMKAMIHSTILITFCACLLFLGQYMELEFLTWASLFTGITGFIYAYISFVKNQDFVLVECKNLSTKATSGFIDKTLRELEDYKASGDTEFKFNHHYFVSANGFVETTLKYALEKGIICYVKNGETFELEKYWK